MDDMTLIRSKPGMMARVAKALGISRQAVSLWDKVPAERLPEVERITGIPRHDLRPDICLPPHEAVHPHVSEAAEPQAAAE